MAGENTVASLNGLFRTVYADKLLDLVPDFAILQKRIGFTGADKETGSFYAQPVNLSHEAGFTYAGTAGGVSALSAAINGVMKEAQVYGSEMVLRSQISYTALSRASSKGPKAFKRASAWKIEDMNNSMRKRQEIAMLYGQASIGEVASVASDVITVTAGSWAGGIWGGAEGAKIQAFTDNTTSATQHGLTAGMTIVSVDSDARTLTMTASDTTTNTNVAAGDMLYFKSARTADAFNEMAGLKKIITNSGTLFNISASTYSLWKGTTASSVGQISFQKIQDAVSKAVNKGLMEDCIVLLSPKAWAVLNSDAAALRVFDSSFSVGKSENGSGGLVFHSTNGKLEILSHPLVKDGDAFIVPPESLLRIGSVDLAFDVPGFEEQFFRLVNDYTAVELQCMSDQAIFIERPAHTVYMSGLTYAS